MEELLQKGVHGKERQRQELEKSQDKKKYYKSKENKSLMSTWEDLGDTLFNEDEEEANLCLMANTTFEKSK
ncbi:hypothetical protein JHK85_010516 [Glycine max]|uniref:Uncharacterized protein n=2 Tax=Glycine subgen. Soja TaxID=1462606 RepID=A0A0R0KFV6_SOYBN|nr:hypothetical protein JHK85_010516 [Glycine max]RZB41523.1 hypothetical protein D0Y65_055166 [Glycine soja]